MDDEARWQEDEEARKAKMGSGDPWDDTTGPSVDQVMAETKEEPRSPSIAPVDMEEVQRKAREEAALVVEEQIRADQQAKVEAAKKILEDAKEAKQRAALLNYDAGRSVDPDFLTALIKAGLGYQGILELLKEMEVTHAKDLQAVKYQDLVDSGLKPIQARKLKAIGMRSLAPAQAPKEITVNRPAPDKENSRAARNSFGGQVPLLPVIDDKKKKKGSIFKRFSFMGSGKSHHAAAFAEDTEGDAGPTTDDLFEEGTQRYFKVERRVNNGEFTWATLSAALKKEMADVRDLWQQAADRGHPKAWHNLGYIYENGSGMVRDAKKAVSCWTKAAEFGDMDAQYNLGVMYAKGRGVERNEAKAVELLTLAADKGDANAQLNLGIMYAKGRGVEKDEAKAFQLWAKAAEQGHASAQYNLGAMYATGRGVEKDLARAVHLYHQAATQGVVQAQYSLGLMYQYGKSVEQNTNMAVELFTRAARQGHAKAQQHLEQLMASGAGEENF